ncbi:MAG: 4-hydroxy-3-methylbut-2-enyl diphosphate reductase [Cellulosilyticum sp.]|nr:4-hydroxy-3-methylbut-2-enyl diphosphate reductase [Cellulosilyticum sp.]MEE1070851.1 4-hydroxy-3-methylbut-2-enyl diphosphate reductase [Cellulosilyticum sp.]
MKVIIAKTAGFCFGVKRAVEMAFSNADEKNTYTYGPIIHNEVVTGELEKKGVYAIDHMEGHQIDKLIIRSHGVSPQVYEQGKKENISIVDATCPYVKKIHHYVEKYNANGYHIIIAGNAMHPEIQGINGWANEKCYIAKDVEELKQIDLPEGKFLLVAQTTYKKEVVDAMKAFLEEKGVEFEYINTICNATKERQEEAVELAKQVDCMLVLGSPKSANTKKLFEISKEHCDKSYCVQGADQLQKDMFSGCECIGITAGASTPESVIEEVIQYINELEK